MSMLKNFEDMQKYGKDNVDATMKVWGQVSKGVQAIAAETADYSKKSFEEGSAALQKLLGAKSLQNAIEIQTAYAKTAYDGFVAQAAGLLCRHYRAIMSAELWRGITGQDKCPTLQRLPSPPR
jgi:hypothetical protein